MLDDGLDNIELNIVCGSGIRDSTILEEKFFLFLILMDEKIHVTP